MILITSFKKKPPFIEGVSVARYQPRGFKLPALKLLAPIDCFGDKITGYQHHGEYRRLYKATLESRQAAVMAWMESLNRRNDYALCCWCNIEQQRAKGYETLMCHTILIAFSIRKHRPDIPVFLDWDRYRYSVWDHRLKPFDPVRYLDRKKGIRLIT